MDEKFRLSNNIDIYVSQDHRFGTDAVLLADFAAPSPNMTVCDLCTGCGIIPLYFCKSKIPKKIYGVELQKEASELFGRSIRENGLEDRVVSLNADLTELDDLGRLIPRNTLDMVTVNPPYYKENSGKERLSEAQRIARHEIACSLEQVIGAADFLLKFGGTLKMCHLPERLGEIFYLMIEYGIQPKKLTLVSDKTGEKPWLALVSGKKGAKAGLEVTETLVMREENGEYTERVRKAYE
ncbi:MAG: methyltransferase [Ruminiclostridium sp.]|nr:methyltransferase [Ruminiclostridium sp.]